MDGEGPTHGALTEKIIGIFYDAYHELGHRERVSIAVGLLLNFGLRPQFRRLPYENGGEGIRVDPRRSAAEKGLT